MEPLDSLNRWSERLRDRARAGTFFRFTWKRFLGDRLFEAAGALSFTTVFALVPLTMVVFGVLSAFPVFDEWSASLKAYIFANFVPRAASAVQGYLSEFSANTRSLTTAGALALVVSLLVTLSSVEAIFNRIWRVATARPRFGRFLVYWTVLTLGGLVAASSLALSTRFFALAIFETVPGRWLEAVMLQLAPMAIEMLAFAAIFKVVPHRTVRWRHALAGAALSVLLFELVKWGIGLYIGSFGSYQKIYGPLAFVPIFLLWIYLGWSAILFGASFASSMSAFRYQPAALRLPDGYELYGVLRMLGRFQHARGRGKGLHGDEIQQLEPILTDALVQELLAKLNGIDVVRRAESGEWLLARDLDDVTLGDLYEAARLRVPVAEAHLPHREDALGVAVMNTLDGLRMPLRDLLKQRVSSVFEGIEGD
ncbi:MAG: YihY family inner membrane protein [Thermomonas sp.]|jgi:membrane protein|uniref:YihY family inner membrane protein n=1 Tax=Thermomonas sp. TaxID=1971895 RepID=UPI001B77DDD9|nr:YihY family inner membrane protein [Thermomonas sp.]MBK9668989.1 YihY family inner membrane protein [Thermomonas sp.]MBP6438010.1 YihY family inner membrane protein [Thermomonas sp.]MBP7158762.1 YihY family inner membrane protein [Thermomonas sp.]MBP8615721.1 YihY family inner membrane protein [Thermomonas sp.]MBP8647148.1 YihY family inner membrane protein [Thermomonas sp.]